MCKGVVLDGKFQTRWAGNNGRHTWGRPNRLPFGRPRAFYTAVELYSSNLIHTGNRVGELFIKAVSRVACHSQIRFERPIEQNLCISLYCLRVFIEDKIRTFSPQILIYHPHFGSDWKQEHSGSAFTPISHVFPEDWEILWAWLWNGIGSCIVYKGLFDTD